MHRTGQRAVMKDLEFTHPALDAALRGLPRPVPGRIESDEMFWSAVQGLDVTTAATANLENGYWGAMAEPAKATFRHWTDRINLENTAFIRRHWGEAQEAVHCRLAEAAGMQP